MYTYDKAGRKRKEERPLASVLGWTYTPMGDVETATDADKRVTTNSYSKRRYLETARNNAGETTQYDYDGEGHQTSMQRPVAGHTWQFTYDEADRLSTVTDAYGTTTYGYDADGNRTSQEDANHHTTSFGYDARHHRRSLTYPDAGSGSASAHYTYDADGNLTQEDTPNGRTRIISVDALNRTTGETISTPAPTEIASVTYTHDGNGNVVGLAEVRDTGTRSETRHYDAFDRLDQEVETLFGVPGKALSYDYDAVGNRKRVTDISGTPLDITTWTYNDLNQNDSVTVPGQGTTSIEYFPSGLLHKITRADQTTPVVSTTTTEYDTAGRIQLITHAAAGSELAHERYDYDADGNRWHQYESNGAVTGNAEQTTTYGYDAADRLIDVAELNGRHTHYEMDPVGNRTREQIYDASNHLTGDSTLVYNAREQLSTRDAAVTGLHVALTYDNDGNTATESDASGTLRFIWDGNDRLLGLGHNTSPPDLTFDYQSDGLRIAKHQGNAETRYQYDGQSLLAETNALGNLLVRYHYSATQLLSRSETTNAQERQYLNDALNTPIATVKQGTVDSRTKYDAWGEITAQQGQGGALVTPSTDGTFAELASTDNQDIGFTGYVKDSESGFYYAKARYYDPRIARFESEDPEEGKVMQPPSLHRYLYAYANPTRFSDRTGRNSEEIQGGIGVLELAQAYLDETTKQLPENRVGNTISGGIGFGQLFLGLTKNALQVVDAADDLVKVGIGSTGVRVDQAQLSGAKKGFEKSGDFAISAANYLLNGGPIKSVAELEDTFRQAEQGNNLAISRSTSLFGGILTGSAEADAIATAGTAERGLARLEGPGTRPLLQNDSSVTQTAPDARELSATTPSQLHPISSSTSAESIGATPPLAPIESAPDSIVVRPIKTNAVTHRASDGLPIGSGKTGSNYDKSSGQGLYILRDDSGKIRYVGRGDAPSRIAEHANTPGKDDLTGEILWNNNLTKAQAKGLEQCLMNYCGGPMSQNPYTDLLNKIRSYAPENPNASAYEAAATEELWEETLKRVE